MKKKSSEWWALQTIALIVWVAGSVLIAIKLGWLVLIAMLLVLWGNNLSLDIRDKD